MKISGATRVAGVVGSPVNHSLSPLIHNAWLEAAGVDGVYVAFPCGAGRFAAFVEGLRGGTVAGLNVTVPFKEEALAATDEATPRAARAGAANLLVFRADGTVWADNTDGEGLMGALAVQAPGLKVQGGPVVVLGAGGAARGAAAALLEAGASDVRIVNRTLARAEALAEAVSGPVSVFGADDAAAFDGAGLVVNATTLGLGGGAGPKVPFARLAPGAAVMDMVYRPLETDLLARGRAAGLIGVDGLEMLIHQAAPSFEAFFGQAPPKIDVRALALKALKASAAA